jgi:putative inorganic carbon (HCO3(-)) transporter
MPGAVREQGTDFIWIGIAIAASWALARMPLLPAAALLFGSIFAALTLWKPQIGILALGFTVPFGSLKELHFAGAQVTASEAIIGLILLAWLFRMAESRRLPNFTAGWLVPLLLFLGAITASLWVALSIRSALPELVKWVEVLVVYLTVRSFSNLRWKEWMAVSIVLGADMEALVGAWQFFTRTGPKGFILHERFLRAYGTFQQPNPFAGYLGIVLPIALSLSIWALLEWRGGGEAERWLTAAFFGSSTLLLLAAVGMSWSRGAWLGVSAAIVTVALLRPKRSALILVLSAAIGLALVFAVRPDVVRVPGTITQRLSDVYGLATGGMDIARVQVTDENFASIERLAHWVAGLRMWADHPWFGVGIGNYPIFYSLYNIPRWQAALGHAHNYYINIAAETGIFGLTAYLAMWIGALVVLARGAMRKPALQAALATGAIGSVVHLSLHNGFDNLFVHGIYLILAIAIGIGEAEKLSEEE